jgi:FkbM family methyltransferase
MGLYHRLKASRVYDLYWLVFGRRILYERRTEVDFYRRLLPGFRQGDLIFDIGANHGAKTDVFLRLGARVVAVEPDETNAMALRQKFLNWRLLKKPVVVETKAVSEKSAVELLWIDEPGSAKNTLSQKWVELLRADPHRFGRSLSFSQQREVRTTTVEDLMAAHGVPAFIKIDVEGAEPRILRGMKRPVPCLSFEVNLPEFRPEGLECISSLHGIDTNGRFNYAVDCAQGLVLDRWIDAAAFARVLGECGDSSVEVFWKSQSPAGRVQAEKVGL